MNNYLFPLAIFLHIFSFAESKRECKSTHDCAAKHLCIRGKCQVAFTGSKLPPPTAHATILSDECFNSTWPNLASCVVWYETENFTVMESNNVPPYSVEPYCPFGMGQGYCQSPNDGNSTECDPFDGMICPCVENSTDACSSTLTGDVMVPVYQLFNFPNSPDPTDASKPKHLYDDSALTNGNTFQVIGGHLNGVQIKGPAEANGFNVDTSNIYLPCGGHVTPPVEAGPSYHYHKAPDCLELTAAHAEHPPLIGYASDGFGIYGFGDLYGMPVLDECNGHFGQVIRRDPSVVYHYHATPVTNTDVDPHTPYFMGCQGPSKGQCNSTVNSEYDNGANWCGEGCGSEICVQPGTDPEMLMKYLDDFAGRDWLSQFSVNDFEIV